MTDREAKTAAKKRQLKRRAENIALTDSKVKFRPEIMQPRKKKPGLMNGRHTNREGALHRVQSRISKKILSKKILVNYKSLTRTE